MRKLRRGIVIGIWTIIALYLVVILLLNIPAMKTYIAQRTSAVLAEAIGSVVSIERVDLGLLNRVIIDDVSVSDTLGQPLLAVGRASVKVSLTDLIQGKITISSAQLFGLKANLYKDEGSLPNYQFVLDAFASDDDSPSKPLNLKVNSLIIRRSEVVYDDRAYDTNDTFTPHHFDVKNISAHIIANAITNDSLNLHIRRLSCTEQSGINLQRLSLKIAAGEHSAALSDCELRLPNSQLHLAANATYTLTKDTTTHVSNLKFEGKIFNTSLSPADLHLFASTEPPAQEAITLAATVAGTDQQARLTAFELQQGENLSLRLTAAAEQNSGAWDWTADIDELNSSGVGIVNIAKIFGKDSALPVFTEQMGRITVVGKAAQQGNELLATTALTSALGNIDLHLLRHADLIRANIEADSVDLAVLTNRSDLGTCSLAVDVEGGMEGKDLNFGTANATIKTLVFRDHNYQDIAIDADYKRNKDLHLTASVADDLGNVEAQIDYQQRQVPLIAFDITTNNLQPAALHLTDLYPDAAFSFALNGSIAYDGVENTTGEVHVSNFAKTSNDDSFTLSSLFLTMENDRHGAKRLVCQSDFATILLEGTFQYATLYDSFKAAVTSQLPIVPLHSAVKARNQFDIYATFMPSTFASELLNIPLQIDEPAHFIAKFDDINGTLSLNADASNIHYNGTNYYDNYLIIASPSDTIRTLLSANSRDESGNSLQVALSAKAFNNQLSSSINFDSHYRQHIKGSINAQADFNGRSPEGKQMAEVAVEASQILVADTVWTINPAHLTYYENFLKVDNLSVRHNQQFVNIDGTAQKGSADDILVTTQDVNVAYILDFIHFTAVSFEGYATGSAQVHNLFTDPTIMADMNVSDFHFEGGAMGTARLQIGYNFDEGKINIAAVAQEEEWNNTTIDGYVSLKDKEIDLTVVPYGASIDFIESYCNDFANISNARGWGNIHVVGPLKEIQILGSAKVSGDMYVTAIQTSYHIEQQTVNFLNNDIVFANDTLADSRGHKGILTGHLPHNHLSNISYDITVTATDLLALDIKEFGDDPYLGTVYASGSCRVRAVPNGTQIDVDVTPEAGSFLTYNATAPDRVSSSFIHWIDREDRNNKTAAKDPAEDVDDERDMLADMNINFLIRCDDRSQLRILMDDRTGDLITLNGSGIITATYYNKGAFNIYGNYLVSSGTYRMTIQDVIQRDFTFQPGGTLSFSGDALDTQINLQAEYSLASVPLADINIGKSFSNNNVRVDCLMNITGTPENPQVDFSLDMPTIGSDAKQMIMSMFADTEELNQQVIYLIAVGRFLNQYSNNSSTQSARYNQTSLAMQSFLSGTISQQLNNVLESLIGSKQWNFGANISPGEEGFNDAEYEGLVSGSMFNSRLLFNGQFGYRDNPNATSSFIGDFDLRYLLVPTGSIAVRIYNETNNRYFTKNTLTTQGVGLIIKKDFSSWHDLFHRTKVNTRESDVVENDSIKTSHETPNI